MPQQLVPASRRSRKDSSTTVAPKRFTVGATPRIIEKNARGRKWRNRLRLNHPSDCPEAD